MSEIRLKFRAAIRKAADHCHHQFYWLEERGSLPIDDLLEELTNDHAVEIESLRKRAEDAERERMANHKIATEIINSRGDHINRLANEMRRAHKTLSDAGVGEEGELTTRIWLWRERNKSALTAANQQIVELRGVLEEIVELGGCNCEGGYCGTCLATAALAVKGITCDPPSPTKTATNASVPSIPSLGAGPAAGANPTGRDGGTSPG